MKAPRLALGWWMAAVLLLAALLGALMGRPGTPDYSRFAVVHVLASGRCPDGFRMVPASKSTSGMTTHR